MARRLAAIMFTDLVGFTASAQVDEPAALARVQEQASVVRPLVAKYGGREIKSTGDGFLVKFDIAPTREGLPLLSINTVIYLIKCRGNGDGCSEAAARS